VERQEVWGHVSCRVWFPGANGILTVKCPWDTSEVKVADNLVIGAVKGAAQ
jgi:hypothetical protein